MGDLGHAANHHLAQPEQRRILVRPGVGATGRIVQKARLTSRSVLSDSATLIFVLQGRKHIRWANGECLAKAGDAIAVRANVVMDITNMPADDGAYEARWVSWTQDALRVFSQSVQVHESHGAATLVPELEPGFRAAYQVMLECLTDVEGIPNAIANHRSNELLLWLHERGIGFGTRAKDPIAARLRRSISLDPARGWTIDDLGRQERSSAASIRRHLAAEGETFRGLLIDVRMSHALALLQNTDASVLTVATSVGYDSASRFAERFKARFGYLPSEVRGHRRRQERGAERALLCRGS